MTKWEQCQQAQVDTFFTAWTEGSPSRVSYTPGGLALAGSEGHLRNAANAALLALVHARHSSGFDAVRLACWARNQVSDHSLTPYFSASFGSAVYDRLLWWHTASILSLRSYCLPLAFDAWRTG